MRVITAGSFTMQCCLVQIKYHSQLLLLLIDTCKILQKSSKVVLVINDKANFHKWFFSHPIQNDKYNNIHKQTCRSHIIFIVQYTKGKYFVYILFLSFFSKNVGRQAVSSARKSTMKYVINIELLMLHLKMNSCH